MKRLYSKITLILFLFVLNPFTLHAAVTVNFPTSTVTEIPEGYESPTATSTATVTSTAVPEILELIKFETGDGRSIDFDGNTITNRVHIVGSISSGLMDHWTLEYKPASDNSWIELNSSVSPVDNAILALFDPTMMLNGIYELRLSLHETNGVITSIKKTWCQTLKVESRN